MTGNLENQWGSFGDALAACLETAGVTQSELARRIQVDPKTISALVTGINQTPRRTNLTGMLAVLRAAGVEEDDLNALKALGTRRRRSLAGARGPSSTELDALSPQPMPARTHGADLSGGTLPAPAVEAPEEEIHSKQPMQQAASAAEARMETQIRAHRPHNLPARSAVFVGREAELRHLQDLLHADARGARAVAITGMGGVGKSTLAAEVVHGVAGDPSAFPGGMARVACDAREGTEGLAWVYERLLHDWRGAPAELSAGANSDAPTPDRRAETYERALEQRLACLPGPALVLLDNVEEAFPLRRLLATLRARGICLLITARHVDAAPDLEVCALKPLTADQAVALFAACCVRKGGMWNAARDESETHHLVRALGNLPLAIALMAARAALGTPIEDLAAEARRDALTAARAPGDTAMSVHRILARSLEQLGAAALPRFAALGLPAGTDWPRPVVEALLSAVPHQEGTTLIAAELDLERMAVLALVDLTVDPASGTRRVRMHPLLRALARREWEQQPKESRIAALLGLTVGVQGWLDTLGGDPHVMMAGDDGPLVVGTVQHALSERAAFTAARERGDPVVARVVMDVLDALSWRLAAIDLTRDYLEQALAAARVRGARDEECRTLVGLGFVQYARDEFGPARSYCAQAVSLCRELGLRNLAASVLVGLGEIAIALRDVGAAHAALDEALALARDVGDRAIECAALVDWSDVARMEGRRDDAADYLQQATRLNRVLGSRYRQAEILAATARWHGEYGDRDLARDVFARAASIFASMGRTDYRGYDNTWLKVAPDELAV